MLQCPGTDWAVGEGWHAMTAPVGCSWHWETPCRQHSVFHGNALPFFFSASQMRYEFTLMNTTFSLEDACTCVCVRAHTCKSVFGREHRNGPSPGHRIWHFTIKHVKAREVERKQTQLLKNLQNTFCVVLSKNIFHIQLKLGAGLYVWGLHKASYIFSLNTQLGEASGLITSHDCVFFSCNIKFIACGSGSDVKLTGTTWSQLVSCFSSHWQGKGTRREASRAMSSLLGIPGKIRSESKKQTVSRKREQ